MCSSEGQLLIEPIVVLDRRMVKKGNKATTQILVPWANILPEKVTWEDYNFNKSQFQVLKNLEDNVLKGNEYSRRKKLVHFLTFCN